jgi:hypothetical protein
MYIFVRFLPYNMSIFTVRMLWLHPVLVYYFHKHLHKSTFYYHILCRSYRCLCHTHEIPFIPLLFFNKMV